MGKQKRSKPSEQVQIHLKQVHLEARQKRYAEVKGPSIFFKQVQEGDTLKKVTVHKKWTGTAVQMAFSFLHKKRTYVLAVEGNTVKLKKKKTQTIPKECFLQWKPKIGEWGILECVDQPNKFLCIQKETATVSSTVSQECEFKCIYI